MFFFKISSNSSDIAYQFFSIGFNQVFLANTLVLCEIYFNTKLLLMVKLIDDNENDRENIIN
ncbi:hypothetical protein JCM15548_13730 [Geofilum rubicundum JCM 15548]|uniref:Uncharacterized protein n=1 Tax=Geofilum rubicundum JCM 15548 TaxID=1236989 RepID=A0A0E9M1M4_9BACT|nr:hypothetical protein JCM15548_13730 [Geofilum rubicundum JCM 15548]